MTYHTFHIPVMGLGFTIDTPIKVAHLGISSTMSVIEDEMMEQLRAWYCHTLNKPYTPIARKDHDRRARRITAYLDLVVDIMKEKFEYLKSQRFGTRNVIDDYFHILPDPSPLKKKYEEMCRMEEGPEKAAAQDVLRSEMVQGEANVNIMAKTDRDNYDEDGEVLPAEFSDAMAALRGYANSKLDSSLVLSAGYNPRLYNYISEFDCFLPDENSVIRKKIVLKVSDFRSALIQGKLLAKKGIPVSGFKIESGLNCGGHAFATNGFLLGPILEEFREKKEELKSEIASLCNTVLSEKGLPGLPDSFKPEITVQGGIGTAEEDRFLREYYGADRTGWGSPFLLVPQATNVDGETLGDLSTAMPDDYYLSDASPLGIPLNNFRKSSSQKQRIERIEKGKGGSPCYKKNLSFNTEFTDKPVCTASRQYQVLKLEQIRTSDLPEADKKSEELSVLEKECLCEGLGASALLTRGVNPLHKLKAVAICPGPNLAYFSGKFTLEEMTGHIYGRKNLLNDVPRPHMFLNELRLYIRHFEKELSLPAFKTGKNHEKQVREFYGNLLDGMAYYQKLADKIYFSSEQDRIEFRTQLSGMLEELQLIAGRLNRKETESV